MPLIDSKETPSKSMQRWFGASLTALFLIIALALRHYGNTAAIILAAVGLVLGAVYYAVPRTQLAIIRGWQIVTFPLAFVLSHLLLGTVFFLVLLPIGIVLRLMKYDPLRLSNEPKETEWIPHRPKSDTSSYFRQF